MAKNLERFFQFLEAAIEELPKDSFDPETIVRQLGNDPIKIFEWVRDNTYLVPYRGSLKGPLGVHMDRLGNSLDRSLLLATMLESAGYKIRLAHATLPQKKVEKITQVMVNVPKYRYPTIQENHSLIENIIKRYAKKYNLNEVELQDINNQLFYQSERLAKEAIQRATDQTRMIYKAIGKPTEAENFKAEEQKKSIEALSDHWWVQVKYEDSWLDIDPTIQDANPGQTIEEVGEIIQLENLDNKLLHSVKIRIIIETWADGDLKEETVLEHQLNSAEVLGEQIVLRHFPLNWPENFSFFEEKDAQQTLKKAVMDEKEWLPVLAVGSTQIKSYSFKDTGEVSNRPGEKAKLGASGITRGLFKAFSGEEDEKKESQLTAEWIEYEISIPGEEARKYRRQVFDLLGPAARTGNKASVIKIDDSRRLERGLALLNEYGILIQICALSPDFVAHMIAKNLLLNREVLKELFLQEELTQDLIDQIGKLPPLPGPEYGLASARLKWSQCRGDIYINTPNIISYIRSIRQCQQGKLMSYNGFDMIENKVAIFPHSKTDPFQINLEQGILDSNIEALLLRGEEKKLRDNTSEIFIHSKNKGIEWLTIRSVNDPSWQNVKLSEDARARIKENLTQGYVVLVPEKAIEIEGRSSAGWWIILPETGQTIGISQEGRGSGMTEYELLKGFKISGWALCAIETTQVIAEQASGHKPHPISAVFLGLCWGLGITSAIMAIANYVGAGAWIIVFAEIILYFLGLGVHTGLSLKGKKK